MKWSRSDTRALVAIVGGAAAGVAGTVVTLNAVSWGSGGDIACSEVSRSVTHTVHTHSKSHDHRVSVVVAPKAPRASRAVEARCAPSPASVVELELPVVDVDAFPSRAAVEEARRSAREVRLRAEEIRIRAAEVREAVEAEEIRLRTTEMREAVEALRRQAEEVGERAEAVRVQVRPAPPDAEPTGAGSGGG